MIKSKKALLGLCAAISVLSTSLTWAQKPSWAGQPEASKSESRKEARKDLAVEARPSTSVAVNVNVGSYFGDSQRAVVRDYYEPRIKAGSCPPGLAKKNNGCLPPGQAKKWQVGQSLPADVVYHSIPNSVLVQLGVPPAGHKYVRVAADILLIAVGTNMVIDAIVDLGRL
jgi:Ni/Co efflux regulator RcnB